MQKFFQASNIFSITLLAGSLFLASSCSNNKPSIIGKWQVVKMDFGKETPADKLAEIQTQISKENMVYEFTKDSNLITTSVSMPKFESKYSATDKEITTKLPESGKTQITKIVSCDEEQLVLDFGDSTEKIVSYLKKIN